VRIPDTALTPVSSRFWLARQVELTLLGLPTIGAGLAGAVLLRGGIAWGIPAATVAWLAGSWFVEYGRYRAWGYAERGDDLIVNRGLLFRRLSVVPYGRMQFIDVTAGPVDRLFGLATVQLHTAAAATDARIPGLRREDAYALRDRLTALGEARATGL
jgi:membrane protein YdbS with pleckstrin-like domain